MSRSIRLTVPQVNINDETVVIARWVAAHGSSVASGDLVCELETTKAVAEVSAPAPGVLVHAAKVGDRVAVGMTIGAIGSSTADATAALATLPAVGGDSAGGLVATPKARALALERGVDLERVRRGGVKGTIKESDVRALLDAGHGAAPSGFLKFTKSLGPVPPFDAAIAANLRRSTQSLILASVDMDCRLNTAHALISGAQSAGRMVSFAHLVIGAAAKALPKFPRLMSVLENGTLYQYQSVDVALVVRTSDGRLFTPVVRFADQLSIEEISKSCQSSTMKVLRGQIKAGDLEGAAFTVSQVPVPGVTRLVALPHLGQSAILGVSAERGSIVTFTLSYDHALCDGVYAAGFLAAIVADLESVTA